MVDEREQHSAGGCLCGAVRYRVAGSLRDVTICHCRFCRRVGTHVGAYTAAETDRLVIESQDTLRWYRSSEIAERGFCAQCGGILFWKPDHGRHMAIAAGSLDDPTHLKIGQQIFTEDKGDYYDL